MVVVKAVYIVFIIVQVIVIVEARIGKEVVIAKAVIKIQVKILIIVEAVVVEIFINDNEISTGSTYSRGRNITRRNNNNGSSTTTLIALKAEQVVVESRTGNSSRGNSVYKRQCSRKGGISGSGVIGQQY